MEVNKALAAYGPVQNQYTTIEEKDLKQLQTDLDGVFKTLCSSHC